MSYNAFNVQGGEQEPLILRDDTSSKGDENPDGIGWLAATFLMIAQMLGIGLLGTPVATAQSGWMAIPLSALCAFLSLVNALLLTQVKRHSHSSLCSLRF